MAAGLIFKLGMGLLLSMAALGAWGRRSRPPVPRCHCLHMQGSPGSAAHGPGTHANDMMRACVWTQVASSTAAWFWSPNWLCCSPCSKQGLYGHLLFEIFSLMSRARAVDAICARTIRATTFRRPRLGASGAHNMHRDTSSGSRKYPYECWHGQHM